MTVIAVCNQKGGSGKTTMAINLAGAFAAEDKRVLLLDLDPQGSALDWGSINPDTMPQVEVAEIDRPQLLRQARALRREYDVIVIDCPAKFADSSSAAIRVADFVLVPMQPSPFDVWASGRRGGTDKNPAGGDRGCSPGSLRNIQDKKRQARTNELEFMESLNEYGMIAYRRVLALGDQEGMRIRWGTKGFSLNVVSDGAHVPRLLRVSSLCIQPTDIH